VLGEGAAIVGNEAINSDTENLLLLMLVALPT
jgi:hypothetical protein